MAQVPLPHPTSQVEWVQLHWERGSDRTKGGIVLAAPPFVNPNEPLSLCVGPNVENAEAPTKMFDASMYRLKPLPSEVGGVVALSTLGGGRLGVSQEGPHFGTRKAHFIPVLKKTEEKLFKCA